MGESSKVKTGWKYSSEDWPFLEERDDANNFWDYFLEGYNFHICN